jgi:hypothetical protein
MFHGTRFHYETVSRETLSLWKQFFMARKTWTAQEQITPELLKFREKRKWQIAFRRYVLEKKSSAFYAPFFGLDIENLRNWFELQFEAGFGWGDFGKKWQFDHIIPVTFFDFTDESELRMCWNFVNLRVENLPADKSKGFDIPSAKAFFQELYTNTLFDPCQKLLEKIDKIEQSEIVSPEKQLHFIKSNKAYLDMIQNYSSFEFEMLNSGRSIDDVKKEVEFFKKFENRPL